MNNRIISIDILRGFAVLGILVMNITSFAMPAMAYFSPVIYEPTFINQIIYCITHVIADQKFMAIFSMLFGASTLLYIKSVIRKRKNPILLFYNRNFWLLIIGWLHSYFIWYGDILFIYALCAFPLYFFKNISPLKQFIFGCIIYMVPIFSGYATYEYILDHLDQVEKDVIIKTWNPTDNEIQLELDTYRGSYSKQVKYREKMWSLNKESDAPGAMGGGIVGLSFLIDLFPRSFGMMLIGMSCFSFGIFSNSQTKLFYIKLIKYGFGIGVLLSITGLYLLYSFDWNWKYVQFLGRSPNHLATPFISAGYIGIIMLWIRKGKFQKFQENLLFIGKTALTLYLIQSIIATSIFYGFGLGLFGYINRFGQIGIMILIWFLLILFSSKWLKRFRYGPIEYIWRSLTNFKLISNDKT